MAKLASIGSILTISCLLVFTQDVYARKQGPVAEEESFLRDIFLGKEKIVKIHLYVQDLQVGHPNATVFEVATSSITNTSPYSFGSIHVLDDLITEEPDINSRPLGRVQGLTTNADLSTYGIHLNLNFYFTVGKLAGSTLSILGRNQILDDQREFPVVGGTGIFRFTRGYAIQTFYPMDPAVPNYDVLEYTIYATYDSKLGESDVVEIAQM
ncbi:dirigent protein 11-like [Salvia miltiorrhiza]|uniref:dirigent protein 11-like n=1 Tax=Salvia miltiorrhiza TaxID=226208 RepID=UPI0025ACD1DC|nr:dirigent protein 11-like [Salvia miltiorrhiza]